MLKRLPSWVWFCIACIGIGGACFVLGSVILNSGLVQLTEKQRGGDLLIFQTAGAIWLHGLNGYDAEAIRQLNLTLVPPEKYDFSYPPHIAPLCMFLSLFPFRIATLVMVGLNNLAAVGMCLLAVRLAQQGCRKLSQTCGKSLQFMIPLLIMGNSLTHSVILSNQTTLMAGFGLMGGWYYAQKQHWLISGCLLGVGSIKPHLGLLIFLWLILERRWKLLLWMGVTILLLSVVPLMSAAPSEIVTTWSANIDKYQLISKNQLGSFGLFGIQNFLYEAGIQVPSLLLIALFLAVLLWRFRAKLLSDDIPALLLGMTLLLSYSRSYDLAALIPFLLAAFWKYWYNRPRQLAIAAFLGILVFLPRIVLRSILTNELLLQYRVPIILVFTIWLLIASLRQQRVILVD